MIENYVLIIGAMKAGTTTLFDILGQHSKIAPCRNKEPGFFAFEEHWAQGFDWYEALFDFDSDLHRYGLDGSTDYTKHPFCTGVAERLAASAPRRFKLIYLMRDPLKRLESQARHVQATGKEVGRTPSPRRDHGLDHGISPVAMAASRYATQLEAFEAFRERGDLLPMVFEELFDGRRESFRPIFDFLDLEFEPHIRTDLASNSFTQRRRRTETSWRLRGSRTFNRIPAILKNAILRGLEPPLEVEGRFKLTAAEREALADALRPEMMRLRDVHGLDVERHWSSIPLGGAHDRRSESAR